MPECIFVGTGAAYGKVCDNYTYSRWTAKVSAEYSATSSLTSALRLCWGPHHIDVRDNVFITSAGKTDGFRGNARCIWAACSDPRQPEWKISGEIDCRPRFCPRSSSPFICYDSYGPLSHLASVFTPANRAAASWTRAT